MSWLLFYILVALYPAVAFTIWKIFDTWRWRMALWVLMVIPAVWYCLPYYQIKNEHARMCANEAGLKVLIQPEKVDRVRLMGTNLSSAKGILERYYPQVQLVEEPTNTRLPNGSRMNHFDAFTATPNPKAGQLDKFNNREYKLIYDSSRVETLDPTMFEISEQVSDIPNGTKTETLLSRSGKVYAKHTAFVHWWTGIQYPDALPTWRCNGASQPKEHPNMPPERWWAYAPSSTRQLTDLIFN